MKTAVLLAATVQAAPNTLELAEGFLVGAFDMKESVIVKGNLQFCGEDLKTALVDVASGIRDLSSLDMHGLSMFTDSLGAAFWKMGEVLEDCDPFKKIAGSKEALQELAYMHTVFTKPSDFEAKTSLPRNLKINKLDIWYLMARAGKDALENDWGNAGYDIGQAARKVIGTPVSLEQIKVADSLY